jgi:hypothetical protein
MPETTPPTKSEIEAARKKLEADRESRATAQSWSELLFVILPFIVIAITLLHRGEIGSPFYLPEWSIVSSVIMGQSIMRLVSSALGGRVKNELFMLVLTAIFVFGLAPNLSSFQSS